jgi:hypothetical protein
MSFNTTKLTKPPIHQNPHNPTGSLRPLIAQNKPNFKNTQINTKIVITNTYVNFCLRDNMKNKAKQSQS